MALTFGESKGAAQKPDIKTFKFSDGINKFRVVGDILPRYVYWIKGKNDKNIPFECLRFNRETEAFDNAEKDWVQEYYPDVNCSWAYATQCIANGELLVVNLKKKMWEQVILAAEDLGDPTDVEKGWDIVVKRERTGPLPFNVAYQLVATKCKERPLTEEERELIKDLKSMDEILSRPTPEAQKKLLDEIKNGKSESPEENQDDDAIEQEFKQD
jgi:hypothetical protein